MSDFDSSPAAGVNFTLPLVVGDVSLISPFVFSCCFSFSSLVLVGFSVLSVSFGFSVDFSSAMAFSIS